MYVSSVPSSVVGALLYRLWLLQAFRLKIIWTVGWIVILNWSGLRKRDEDLMTITPKREKRELDIFPLDGVSPVPSASVSLCLGVWDWS